MFTLLSLQALVNKAQRCITWYDWIDQICMQIFREYFTWAFCKGWRTRAEERDQHDVPWSCCRCCCASGNGVQSRVTFCYSLVHQHLMGRCRVFREQRSRIQLTIPWWFFSKSFFQLFSRSMVWSNSISHYFQHVLADPKLAIRNPCVASPGFLPLRNASYVGSGIAMNHGATGARWGFWDARWKEMQGNWLTRWVIYVRG